MKRDIENRDDIKLLVDHFYQKVKVDTSIGFLFNDIAKVNWSQHIPVMCDFWENILLHTGTYDGNPINLHKHLSHLSPLRELHFDQWNKLFAETVNEHFRGKNARLAIKRALNIAKILRVKILGDKEDNNIY
jgi:hemoglobin